jgi:hypothetical protein
MFPIEHRALAIVAAALLCGCVAHQPSLLRGTQGFIPGRDTAGLEPDSAREKILRETAKIAVDHGYRYFILLSGAASGPSNAAPIRSSSLPGTPSENWAITPGAPVRFRLLKGDEKRAQYLQRWDAYSLLQPPAHDTKKKLPPYSFAR